MSIKEDKVLKTGYKVVKTGYEVFKVESPPNSCKVYQTLPYTCEQHFYMKILLLNIFYLDFEGLDFLDTRTSVFYFEDARISSCFYIFFFFWVEELF